MKNEQKMSVAIQIMQHRMSIVLATRYSRVQFTALVYCYVSMQSQPAAISFSNSLGSKRSSHEVDTLALQIDPLSSG